jgi:hypothetical protein
MGDPEITGREFDRLSRQVAEHEDKLAKVDVLIVKVDLMTDTFRSLKVIGTGVIVAVLSTAFAILAFGGPVG